MSVVVLFIVFPGKMYVVCEVNKFTFQTVFNVLQS